MQSRSSRSRPVKISCWVTTRRPSRTNDGSARTQFSSVAPVVGAVVTRRSGVAPSHPADQTATRSVTSLLKAIGVALWHRTTRGSARVPAGPSSRSLPSAHLLNKALPALAVCTA